MVDQESRLFAWAADLMERPPIERISVFCWLALGPSVFGSLWCWFCMDQVDTADMRLLTPLLVFQPLPALGGAVLGGIAARRGSRGTAVLYGGPIFYGLYCGLIAVVYGTWTTSILMMAPIIFITFSLVAGRAYAWAGLATTVAVIVVDEVLVSLDVVGRAPLFSEPYTSDPELWLTLSTVGTVLTFAVTLVGASLILTAAGDVQRRRLARGNLLIRRYVPSQVAEAVVTRGGGATGHGRRKITVFFSDIVGFTETTERLEPEELATILNEYFTAMTAIADSYDGTVDELVGDAVLILFGAPTATDDHDHARRAVRMALEMQAETARLNAAWAERGIDAEFGVRMGVNTGVVTVGDFGSADRVKYAALGQHVNLAARIQTHCPPGQVLLSHGTWLLVNKELECEARGEVDLKGVGRPTRIYQAVGAQDTTPRAAARPEPMHAAMPTPS